MKEESVDIVRNAEGKTRNKTSGKDKTRNKMVGRDKTRNKITPLTDKQRAARERGSSGFFIAMLIFFIIAVFWKAIVLVSLFVEAIIHGVPN